MKKLNFLKALVDLVWILNCIVLPVLFIFILVLFFGNDSIDIPFKVNGIEVKVIDLKMKITLIFLLISLGFLVYGLFLFKKLLGLFQQKIIFELENVNLLKKIGYLICISSIIGSIASFTFELWQQNISIHIGLNSFILLLSLGLFFLVLSEVFEMAKTIKEENDLTF